MTSEPVVIMAASFGNAALERLPFEEDDQEEQEPAGAVANNIDCNASIYGWCDANANTYSEAETVDTRSDVVGSRVASETN
ncbi:hypothetical protein Bca4012_018338 [Brassica carinata]